MAWKKDARMTKNSMWDVFWRLEGQHTGGIGIWDEPFPYTDTGEEGYTVVIRDSADDVLEEFNGIYSKTEAMRLAKDLMKDLNTTNKFCKYIKKKGGYAGENCDSRSKR